jgi:hypothetical protein
MSHAPLPTLEVQFQLTDEQHDCPRPLRTAVEYQIHADSLPPPPPLQTR